MVYSSLRAFLAYAGSLAAPYQEPLLPASSSSSPSSSSPSLSLGESYHPFANGPSCPIDGPVSCHNSTPVAPGDSCCFVSPGGRMLLTQFWDQQVHAGGADTDWTLHGLWPDLCDGTYDQFCGMTPMFNNITEVLESYGQHDMIDYMNRYWLANAGPNSNLWKHEFNKHGTCVNTLSPTCYGDSHTPGLEVVDYFTRATGLFRKLDTYTALKEAGIVPNQRTHYPLADVQAALEKFSGGRVVLRCTGGGRGRSSRGSDVLHEAWYVYFVRGSLQSGEFVPAQDSGKEKGAGNCAPWVRYLPKKARGQEL